jgi:hypothetical protein
MIGRVELITSRHRQLLHEIAADSGAADAAARLHIRTDSELGREVWAGTKPLSALIEDIPPSYQRYLDLGRFRTAIIEDFRRRHPGHAINDFCLRVVQPPRGSSPMQASANRTRLPLDELSGAWQATGEWSGWVEIDGERAVYAGTAGDDPGAIAFAQTGKRSYSGFWKQSEEQCGTLNFTVSENGEFIEGTFHVSDAAAQRSGHSGRFRWTRTPETRVAAVQPEP